MKRSKGYLLRACYSKDVSHHHLYFVKLQVGIGVGMLYSRKKEGFRFSLSGGCWHEETVGTGTRSGTSHMFG